MKKFLDTEHPMFRRLWVRVLVVLLPAAWAVVEFLRGSPVWGMIFAAFAAYGAWAFFIDPAGRGGRRDG